MTEVLHVTAGHAFGGIESMLVTVARHQYEFPAVRHAFALCFEGRLADELREAGARVSVLGAASLSRPWSVMRARDRLRRVVRARTVDVVATHGMWPHALFAPVARLLQRPVVYFAHGGASPENWADRMGRRVVPDHIVANSRFTAGQLDSFFDRVEVDVVHCPVEVRPIPVGVLKREELRRANGVGPRDVVIIQVSRMERGKGHALHLEALARIRDLDRWRCWFVGGAQIPEERAFAEELAARARSLGLDARVRFLGQRSEVGPLLAAADIYCQPNSLPDSFGITFIEAMNAGLPVIGTSMGGALETITPDTGLLVSPDAAAVAGALASMIGDPTTRARMGAAGPARAADLSAPSGQVVKLARVLRSVEQGKPSGIISQTPVPR